jgi:hypothetical protein
MNADKPQTRDNTCMPISAVRGVSAYLFLHCRMIGRTFGLSKAAIDRSK